MKLPHLSRARRCFAAFIAVVIGFGAVLPSGAAADETAGAGCHRDEHAGSHQAQADSAPHHLMLGGQPTGNDDQSVPCQHCPADACALLAPCAGVSPDAAILNVVPSQDRTSAQDRSFGAIAPVFSVISLPSTPPPRPNL